MTNGTELKCEAPNNNNDNGNDNDNEGDHSGSNGARDDGGPGPSGGDGGGQGDDNGQGEQMCSTAALMPGTAVSEAELKLTSAGAVWDEVELVTP
jgi:hypothetical protein